MLLFIFFTKYFVLRIPIEYTLGCFENMNINIAMFKEIER